MTSNRFSPRSTSLAYDPSRAFVPFTGFSRTELIALNDRQEAARRELLDELASPSDRAAAFVYLPERMLTGYRQSRRQSELGRILGTGKRLRDAVDRVVVVGGSDCLGASIFFEAGCHPYHNELSRGDRGGRPRIYFAGDRLDNDEVQGLLDLLGRTRPAVNESDRWAIVRLSAGKENAMETAAVELCLLAALRDACGGDECAMSELVVPADGDGGRFAILSAAGLLPAAVMGMDIVRLLQGAAMMNERFRAAPPGDNPALDHAAVSHVMRHLPRKRRMVPWASALEAAARWCDQLQTKGTAGLETHLVVEAVRRDRLVVPANGEHAGMCGKSIAELQSGAIHNAKEARAASRIPIAELVLPELDESTLGQFLQMAILAAAIEDRLARDIPDGQAASEPQESSSE